MSWVDRILKLKTAVEEAKVTRQAPTQRTVCIHGDTDCIRCASADFEAQEDKTTKWVELDPMDVRKIVFSLSDSVRRLVRESTGKIVLAGGYIRASVGNEPIHDIDLFINEKDVTQNPAVRINWNKTDDEYVTRTDSSNRAVQLIWRYPFKEPYEILEAFDYTAVKAAIWFDNGDASHPAGFKGICHEHFYRDVAHKLLVCDNDRDIERLNAIPRLLKYISYGYSIEPTSLAEIIAKTCLSLDLSNGFEGVVKGLEKMYTPTGNDKEWSELQTKFEPPPPPKARVSYDYGS